ncbi:MAG TPA: hypothetical protein VFP05_14915 [Thermomicrobiales bacterium]|nr:hypothetical protein [Thermomicrobiales bacterium]
MDTVGPLQLIVIDFESAVLPPLVHAQLDDLRRRGVVRMLDSLVTVKGDEGRLVAIDTLDAPRGELVWSGVLARSLLGSNVPSSWNADTLPVSNSGIRPVPELCVTEEQLLEIADLIPTNSRALVLLVEHLWTADLFMAAFEARGHVLAHCWISPAMLAQMVRRTSPLLQ